MEDRLARRIAAGPSTATFGMSDPTTRLFSPVPGRGSREGRLQAGVHPAVLDVAPGGAQRQQGLAAKEPLNGDHPPVWERSGIVVVRLSHAAIVPQRRPGGQGATALLPRLPTRPGTGVGAREQRAATGPGSPSVRPLARWSSPECRGAVMMSAPRAAAVAPPAGPAVGAHSHSAALGGRAGCPAWPGRLRYCADRPDWRPGCWMRTPWARHRGGTPPWTTRARAQDHVPPGGAWSQPRLGCHVQDRGEGHAPPPRAHPPLHGRRAHAATATVLRASTCPPRAAAIRPGPAPDSAGAPAWGRSRAPGPHAAPLASDSETACRNRGNAPARIRWSAASGRSSGPMASRLLRLAQRHSAA